MCLHDEPLTTWRKSGVHRVGASWATATLESAQSGYGKQLWLAHLRILQPWRHRSTIVPIDGMDGNGVGWVGWCFIFSGGTKLQPKKANDREGKEETVQTWRCPPMGSRRGRGLVVERLGPVVAEAFHRPGGHPCLAAVPSPPRVTSSYYRIRPRRSPPPVVRTIETVARRSSRSTARKTPPCSATSPPPPPIAGHRPSTGRRPQPPPPVTGTSRPVSA
jgi:hypothetical protein